MMKWINDNKKPLAVAGFFAVIGFLFAMNYLSDFLKGGTTNMSGGGLNGSKSPFTGVKPTETMMAKDADIALRTSAAPVETQKGLTIDPSQLNVVQGPTNLPSAT